MKRIDYIDKRFGRLIVLSLDKPKYYPVCKVQVAMWKCRCDCGNIIITQASNLRTGHTKSCGCLIKDINRYNKYIDREQSAKNNLYTEYKRSAINRKLEFSLEKNYFIELVTSNCYYCNAPPSRIHKKHTSKFVCNGIDRFINTIGYTINNSVSCCADCNFLKHSLDGNHFLLKIDKIYINIHDKLKKKSGGKPSPQE